MSDGKARRKDDPGARKPACDQLGLALAVRAVRFNMVSAN
jgi:hypothetical protein